MLLSLTIAFNMQDTGLYWKYYRDKTTVWGITCNTHTHIQTHTHMYTRTHTHTHIHSDAYAYTYTRTHTHTHTYAQTHMLDSVATINSAKSVSVNEYLVNKQRKKALMSTIIRNPWRNQPPVGFTWLSSSRNYCLPIQFTPLNDLYLFCCCLFPLVLFS